MITTQTKRHVGWALLLTLSTGLVCAQTTTSLTPAGVATKTDLAASAALSPEHSTLLQLLNASGLAKQAAGKGAYTVFAPTNEAFSALSETTLRELLLPSSKKRLARLLAYHVVRGRLTSDRLKDGQTLTNLTGQILVVHKQENAITITDSRGTVADVTLSDIRATNGVIYSINKVLQPSVR